MTGTLRPDVPVRMRIVDAIRILIAVKSLGVITGDLLYTLLKLVMVKCVFNITGTFAQDKGLTFELPASSWGISAALNVYIIYFGNMLVSVIIFILILLSTGALTVAFHAWPRCPSENVRANCVKGASFIPAWAWRDVVASFMTAAMVLMSKRPEVVARSVGLETHDVDAAILALVVTIGSALFSVWLETKAINLEPTSFWRGIIDSMRNAFAMGVAYAFNVFVDNLFGVNASHGWRLAVYLGVLSILIPCMQHYGQLVADRHREQCSHTVYVGIDFSLLALRWVLGWAWREVLILYLRDLHGNVLAYFATSLFVTFLGVTIVVLLQLPVCDFGFDGTLVVGMNLGWIWKKFSWQCFNMMYGDDPTFQLMVLHTLATIFVVGVVAAILDQALSYAKGVTLEHPDEKDERVLLLSARDRRLVHARTLV